MKSFTFQTAGKIVSGWNALEQLSDHLDTLPGLTLKRVLIVSMDSMVQQGFVPSIESILQEKGAETRLLTDIMPEPSESHVEEVMQRIEGVSFDLMIGIGGGSVLDATKLLSVLATNDLSLRDMVGTNNVQKAGVPTVLIPTTSGTGAEVTPNAIVTLEDEKLKAGIVSPFLYPELVILDASLTILLPKPITAATGMDAYTHALESFISNKANPISDMFAAESMRLISQSLLKAYDNGDSQKDREQTLIGSMYGGLALSASGTAAVHALAYPLGGEYNVAHGVANSMLLPHVMKFNADAIQDSLKDRKSVV